MSHFSEQVWPKPFTKTCEWHQWDMSGVNVSYQKSSRNQRWVEWFLRLRFLFWQKASETHELVTWKKLRHCSSLGPVWGWKSCSFPFYQASAGCLYIFANKQSHRWYLPPDLNIGVQGLAAQGQIYNPESLTTGRLMHLMMFFYIWGDWLRGYLQCARAYCHWPWEEGLLTKTTSVCFRWFFTILPW